MRSSILHMATPVVRFMLLFFSVMALIRGHNHPGGGFIGGLLAASAFIFDALAHDVSGIKSRMKIKPAMLIGIGLIAAFVSTLPGLLFKGSLMEGMWMKLEMPLFGLIKLGTPLLFDVGVYFAVMGVSLLFLFTLMEEWTWK